jgi:hypothetical protein
MALEIGRLKVKLRVLASVWTVSALTCLTVATSAQTPFPVVGTTYQLDRSRFPSNVVICTTDRVMVAYMTATAIKDEAGEKAAPGRQHVEGLGGPQGERRLHSHQQLLAGKSHTERRGRPSRRICRVSLCADVGIASVLRATS